MTIVVPTFARAKPDHDIAAADFRGAMRHLVGGVSVITVGQGQDISGMTVTSVS
jgi:flavin reductase (DIM6/NTAB) family NADH-FMN oxidoreductase RutF